MNLKETLAKLESMGDEKRRGWNVKNGAGKMKQFGVAMGDLRALAKKIKTDHELALQLWKTGNIDAQLLAILLMKPKSLSAAELDKMVRAARRSTNWPPCSCRPASMCHRRARTFTGWSTRSAPRPVWRFRSSSRSR